ncbi:MAG: DMT family transporter [Treponema sp.]|jgi:drug/metabolite transporter (DMT)-like permease|nr:DMT family transporter [Treponema sp.]
MRHFPNIDKSSRHLGQGAIFLCAILWSTSGLCIKLLDWPPILIAGARSSLAALVLAAVKFLKPRKVTAKAPPLSIFAGGCAYAATMLLFVIANKLTAPANAILLQYGAPIWAAMFGWLLIHEKPQWEHWGALVLVMGGMALFFKDSLALADGLRGGVLPRSLLGDGIAVLSGICFGLNSVFLRMMKDGDPADAMLLAHIFTAAFSVPFFFFYPPSVNSDALLAVAFMGVFQIGLASLLFAYGIKRVPAIQAMLTAMIEPVLNPVWVLLVTGETPAASAIAGGSVIVAAVAASSIIGKRREIG